VLETNFDLSCGISDVFGEPCVENYVSKRSKPTPEAANGFNPCLFVDFFNEGHLVIQERYINSNHPYIQWYFKAYPLLSEKFSNYAQQLIYKLFQNSYSRKPQYEEINKILDKLRVVLQIEMRPPKELKLTENDFRFKMDNS